MIWYGRVSAEVARAACKWVLKEGGCQAAQELMIVAITVAWRLLV